MHATQRHARDLAHARAAFPMARSTIRLVSKLANQDIELFRAGDYGAKGAFTPADLDQMVANFNSGNHDVPLVVGHPEAHHPAFGWIGSLKRVGNTLVGRPKDVEPTFEAMVKDGLFKKRSVALVKGDGAGWVVRHVGWLGAKAPEVKGLADCKFEAGSAAVTEFQEDVMAQGADKSIAEQIRAYFVETFGTQPAAKTFSEEDVTRIATAAVATAVKPLQDELTAAKATFSARDEQLRSAETDARADAAVAKLKAKGRWVPAFDMQGLPAVFNELAKSTVTIEFAEGDKKKQVSPLDSLVLFLEALPAIVPNAPVYTGQTIAGAPATAKGVNGSPRLPVDPNSAQLDSLVQARAAERKISYGDALSQVAAEKPELTVPGGASAGAV